MTSQLQHAMAQYEDARIQYKKAVLASLNGTSRLRSLAPSPGGSASNGEAIRQAIRQFQDASAELKRHRAALPTLLPVPQNEPSPSFVNGSAQGWVGWLEATPPSIGPQVSALARLLWRWMPKASGTRLLFFQPAEGALHLESGIEPAGARLDSPPALLAEVRRETGAHSQWKCTAAPDARSAGRIRAWQGEGAR